jgi:nucleotide-binding universal stress UspA family protein
MAHVSHKLKNAFEGALAGGGDPATSPLYVFGPFLKLIVVAGVAQITFGASIWLVILTIAVVSAMYRLVMRWVVDGSGGSGLSEEEFGSWAVKVNAAITFIEYTLTFLVSMAAMVTFIADRIPVLNHKFLWIQYRTLIAILLSVLTGWLVNRGPKMAARTFGPATAGVLALLWLMVFATIFKFGVQFPDFNPEAFKTGYFHFTIGGYVRILAVMTGIEVFANLVAAYGGTASERSNKAFVSLLIIMGTTGITMLIVGPAIFQLADPSITEVSVFTQTMDKLLPKPLPLLGTLVGVAVLMSASAASAQGLQNLALGLRKRRYVPPTFGKVNQFEVADKPVWAEVWIVSLCFLLFGTHEETYLALYAAGVFILLSMTGWAVTKRLVRQLRDQFSIGHIGLISGTVVASLLTTAATVIIFEERFLEGAWTYLVFIPLLYAFFSYFRNRLGAPSPMMEYLGRLDAAQLAGFGFGQVSVSKQVSSGAIFEDEEISWQPEPIEKSVWRDERIELEHIAVLLDGSLYAAQAIPYAEAVARAANAQLVLLSSVKNETQAQKDAYEATVLERQTYLAGVAEQLRNSGLSVSTEVRTGYLADTTKELVEEQHIDLVVTSTVGKSGNPHWLSGGISSKLMRQITTPVLLVQMKDQQAVVPPKMNRILVSLDGSILAENTLPYARAFAKAFNSEIILLAVPQVPEVKSYRAPDQAIEQIRNQMESTMDNFLEAVARSLREDGLEVRSVTKGSLPVRTIVSVGAEEDVDLIMLTSRGRGGIERLFMGSVAESVVAESDKAVLMVPVHEELGLLKT